MFKSGLIVAGIALVVSIGATLITPLCVPCLGVFLGLAAGFLAGVFDKPVDKGASAKSGALGGAIGGVGTVVGQAIGTIINGVLVGPEGTARLLEDIGWPVAGQGADFAMTYWVTLIGSVCCFGLLNIALMAGFGVLGALLWQQFMGKNNNLPADQL
jgi:hypothetical protein